MSSLVWTGWFSFTLGLLLAAAVGLSFFRKFSRWQWGERCILGLLPISLTTLLVLLYFKIRWAVFDEHNWLRLQKSFALAMGFPLYYGPDSGPALATIYGPISVLAYWPATITQSPMPAMYAASLITILCFFLPVLWLHLGGGKKKRAFAFSLLAFFCFSSMAFLYTSLKKPAFQIHADAATLGLSALACGFLYFRQSHHSWRPLILSACCAVLAVWSKQVALPLSLALLFWVYIVDGFRDCLRYFFCLLTAAILSAMLFMSFFDPALMFFNMVTLPRLHPLKADFFQVFFVASLKLIRECLITLLLAVFSFTPLFLWRERKMKWRRWLRTHRWSLFLIVSVFMLPAALYPNMKVGGSNNTFAYTVYFLLIASSLAFLDGRRKALARKDGGMQKANQLGLIAASVILLCIQIPIGYYRIAKIQRMNNFAMEAYEYAKAHPGKAYFPNVPLIHLLVEKRLVHSIDGLQDRRWAGLPLTEKHFLEHTPPQMELIAFHGDDRKYILPASQFPTGYRNTEGLPSFLVYRRV